MSDNMFNDVFNTETVEEVMERTKQRRESFQQFDRIPFLTIGDGNTVLVRFLTNDPGVTYYNHRVWDHTVKKGAGGYRELTCVGSSNIFDCPLCMAKQIADKANLKIVGTENRYLGAYLVVHIDNVEEINGQQVVIPRVKLFVRGQTVLDILRVRNLKRPLSSENIEIQQAGVGLQTKYNFEASTNQVMPIFDQSEVKDLKKHYAPQYSEMFRIAQALLQGKNLTPLSAANMRLPLGYQIIQGKIVSGVQSNQSTPVKTPPIQQQQYQMPSPVNQQTLQNTVPVQQPPVPTELPVGPSPNEDDIPF